MSYFNAISSSAALSAALDYAGLEREQVQCTLICRLDGMYELAFNTDWLRYECYVDEVTAQVLGFSFEPVPDAKQTDSPAGGVLWRSCGRVIAANK